MRALTGSTCAWWQGALWVQEMLEDTILSMDAEPVRTAQTLLVPLTASTTVEAGNLQPWRLCRNIEAACLSMPSLSQEHCLNMLQLLAGWVARRHQRAAPDLPNIISQTLLPMTGGIPCFVAWALDSITSKGDWTQGKLRCGLVLRKLGVQCNNGLSSLEVVLHPASSSCHTVASLPCSLRTTAQWRHHPVLND